MERFISLCMIVKNEEKVLGRCLQSIKDYIDEIIIADTGSIDRTKEVALSFTPNVYDYTWINDFSAARNFVQSKASGKWIIYLDADEYVDTENIKEIIKLLKSSYELSEMDAFVVTQINFVGTLGGNVSKCPTIRIYKNEPTIQFQRRVHEQLFKMNGQLTIGLLDLNIYHSGYLNKTAKEKNKHDRNIPLIKTEIIKNSNDGFDYYNLANEYLSQGDIENALTFYQLAFKLKGSINKLWVPMAVGRIVICLIELKRYNDALEVLSGAVSSWPNAADFRSQKGLILFMQNRFEDAQKELLPLIEDRKVYTTIQSLSYLDYLPYYILGQINEYNNDLANAIYYYSQALNFNNKDTDTLKRFYPLLLKNESKENIIEFINKRKSMDHEINRVYFLKILVNNGEIDLVEHYLKEWRITPSIGLTFKINLVKGRYNYTKSFLNKYSMNEFLIEGWIDSYDILMLALQLDKIEVLQQLLDTKYGEGFKCLETLFSDKPTFEGETLKSHIMILLDRCISMKNFKMIDYIIAIGKKLMMHIEIGDLFYKHGYKEVAIDFYSEVEDSINFNGQTFVNIIELFLEKGNVDDALQWTFTALEQNKTDYRIFKIGIELLHRRNAWDDMAILMEMVSELYPASNYLLELGNKDQISKAKVPQS